MKSEELELSLRTEFENYLKDVYAGMRQEVADFQRNFEAEFEKHKSQMDEAFRNLSERFESEPTFDKPFTESVVEHLRLARDDGAKLTAEAMTAAEKFDRPAVSSYDEFRDAINDIANQTTQSSILRTLVEQVSRFTSRGAFFIVKHDNLVCWKKFGDDGIADDEEVRKVHLPLAADTLLARAVNSLSPQTGGATAEGEDALYLDPLNYGRPERMFAVPLTARGRGVAVLYADRGDSGESVNLEAIEGLVRVAGLTVELRAAAQQATTPVAQAPVEEQQAAAPEVVEEATEYVPFDDGAYVVEEAEYQGEVAVEETAPLAEEEIVEEVAPVNVNDFAFATSESFDASAEVEPEQAADYAYTSDSVNGTAHVHEAVAEPVVEVAASQPAKGRLSDRNVDLPIEVPDKERRFHNDARRFARLLVSEIKLYNEQKVTEGRDEGDLYGRLREAIDRSREMYEKRVKPQVASKFDYFHYELVSNLAEGNVNKLGSGYPGSSV